MGQDRLAELATTHRQTTTMPYRLYNGTDVQAVFPYNSRGAGRRRGGEDESSASPRARRNLSSVRGARLECGCNLLVSVGCGVLLVQLLPTGELAEEGVGSRKGYAKVNFQPNGSQTQRRQDTGVDSHLVHRVPWYAIPWYSYSSSRQEC